MKFDRTKNRVKFYGEEGESLEIAYTNTGDPYREGIDLRVEDVGVISYIFIEESEVIQLRDLLNGLYPIETK